MTNPDGTPDPDLVARLAPILGQARGEDGAALRMRIQEALTTLADLTPAERQRRLVRAIMDLNPERLILVDVLAGYVLRERFGKPGQGRS